MDDTQRVDLPAASPGIKLTPPHNHKNSTAQPDLCNEQHGPIPWVIEPILSEGTITTLFGASGSYKSMLCYSLAHHLAAGQNWLGYTVRRPYSVIYVDEEMPARLVATRNRDLTAGASLAPSDRLRFYRRAGFSTPNLAAKLFLAFDREGLTPEVVFLDTFREVFSAEGGAKENDAGAIRAFYRDLRILTSKGLSIIVIHHAKKAQQAGKGPAIPFSDMVSGSSDFKAASDNFLGLEVIENGLSRLHFLKTREIALPPPLYVTVTGGEGQIRLSASTQHAFPEEPARQATPYVLNREDENGDFDTP